MNVDIFTPEGTEPDAAAHSIDLRLDRELTEDEVRSVADAAFAEFALLEMEAAAEPHVVHQKTPPPGTQTVVDCPDCTRGLSSRGHDLVCLRVPDRTPLRGCHPHCIVACGRPR